MDPNLLAGGIAVLTGSASGMGLSMAKKCAAMGMNVVISDLRSTAIGPAVADIKAGYPTAGVTGFTCDVTDVKSVEKLLNSARSAFPEAPIQFIAANAGVIFPKATILTATPEDWKLTYDVNVMGVANTLRTFVPVLLAQPQQSVVQITASAAGVSFGAVGPYGTSKLAVLGIAEALQREIEMEGALDKIHLVALCPAIVTTGLLDTSTAIEQEKGTKINGMAATKGSKLSNTTVNLFKNVWGQGMTAEYTADQVFEHLQDGKFYCILDNEFGGKPAGLDDTIKRRYESFISRRFIRRDDGGSSLRKHGHGKSML